MGALVRATFPNGLFTCSRRDQAILTCALRKLYGLNASFDDALRALREATEELIPAGRVYLLGSTKESAIVGSIISGIGIVAAPLSTQNTALIVRVDRNDGHTTRVGVFV